MSHPISNDKPLDKETGFINQIDNNIPQYLNVFLKKEELSYDLLESDTELIKQKNELDALLALQKKKENELEQLKNNIIDHDITQLQQLWFHDYIDPQSAIFNAQLIDNTVKFKLTNNTSINLFKEPLSNKLIFKNSSNPNVCGNLNDFYKEDPDTALLYFAFNL